MIQYWHHTMKKGIGIIVFCSAITLILASCMEPVDHNLFLKDDRVQDLIGESNGSDAPVFSEVQSPQLELDAAGIKRLLNDNETITVSLSGPARIGVTNVTVFDTDTIEWYSIQTPPTPPLLLAAISATYDLFSGPIAVKGFHSLAVFAEIEGVLYNTSIVINVVD